MKPVKLIIEGINSFIERQELDFEAVGRSNLFCICGKTGAGKSTVFDSLMLALYGRSGKGTLADAVNLSLNSAYVSLEFTEGDDSYTVERTIKCRKEKGATDGKQERRVASSEAMLYKNGEPCAKGADETNEKITQIIGLEVGEFKNVYLLEQGEYADFLKKQPAKQTEAVGKIFSLMRFGDIYKRAAERAKEEAAAVSAVEDRINDVGEDAPELLRAAKSELSSMRAKNTVLLKELEASREDLEALEKARVEYAAYAEKQHAVKEHAQKLDEQKQKESEAKHKLDDFSAHGVDGERVELEALRKKIIELSELNALDGQCRAAEADLKAKSDAKNKKTENLSGLTQKATELISRVESEFGGFKAAADEFLAAAKGASEKSPALENAIKLLQNPDRDGAVAAVEGITYSLREDKRDYEEISARLSAEKQKFNEIGKKRDELVQKITLYGDELKRLTEEKEKRQKNLENAEQAYKTAMTEKRAEAVRGELKIGDVCPVCGGIYNGFECEVSADVAQKKEEADKAASSLKEITDKIDGANKLAERAKDDLARELNELNAVEKTIAELEQKLIATRVDVNVYAALAVAIKKAKTYADGYAAAVNEKQKLDPVLSAASAEKAAAEEAEAQARKNAELLRERLGESYGKTDEMLKEANYRAKSLEEKVSSYDKRRAELTAEYEAAKAAASAVQAMLDSAVAACPVDIPQFDEDKYNEQKARLDEKNKQHAERERDIAVKSAEIDAFTEKCEKLKILRSERAQKQKNADNYAKIAELTKSKAMLNFVVTEYIEQFTAAASDILAELSNGKYNMGYDSENGFTVSDFLNGGKSRKTDTLSGGELFLASLSVAIAIARSVGHGNNAFFFLDEGFGTLDEELIDTVYGALESLSKDCLVGVISHAGALIERMPSCVEVVEATDISGSRIRY